MEPVVERRSGAEPVARWVRVVVGLLALAEAAVGAWTVLAPRSFFGLRFVSLGETYNPHLLLDVGVYSLAMALLLALAAGYGQRRLVRVALLAFLTYAVGHLAVHATHREALGAAEFAELLAWLALGAVLPLVLLAVTRPRRDVTAREG
ncbi:hypothetical protein [Actinocatenispora rupis]|uniref:Uncharacterized protein n=1 Tax=Actinocatenispora rupis TaxID=519421 RepID=A0A8J3J356_9ACTN|nr:hypothetical protein [Actinocatenispora rupis]GID11117.1 hypothetical protein Aru02nite_20060 [Actinocatenispora rupis]